MQKAHVLGRVNRGSQPERLFPQLQNGLGVTSKASSIFCPGHPWIALSRNPSTVPSSVAYPPQSHSHLAFHPPFHVTFQVGTRSLVPEMLQPLGPPTLQSPGSLLLSARPACPGFQLTSAREAQSLHGYWGPQTSGGRSGHLQVTTVCSAHYSEIPCLTER